MYISDLILKSVAFVAEIVQSDSAGDEFDPWGTGFFVLARSEKPPHRHYPYFVTAKHVAEELKNKDIRFLVNSKSGDAPINVVMASDRWHFHPSDPTADVAVLPCFITAEHDIQCVADEHFMSSAADFQERQIGIGDEVLMPGLFTFTHRNDARRIKPILRHGTIAMLPDEPIQVGNGFAEVYLIEARSIGGMSGSPVFVRGTIAFPWKFENAGNERFLGLSSRPYLLGLMHGHWDIPEAEINKVRYSLGGQRGVNMGIAVVVPASKILETIRQPDLVKLIDDNEDKIRRAISPKPDGR